MKKRELEMRLQRVPPLSHPLPHLEQYSTPAAIAADVLYIAYASGDIEGKRVVDLGCGNGIFAIGARLLEADSVMGLDIDASALDEASENAKVLGVEVDWIRADVESIRMRCDTVLQNPPFGAQSRGADRPFLRGAIAMADSVYSLHILETVPFLEELITDQGATIVSRKTYKFNIPHMFGFHRKQKKSVDVVLLQIRVSR
jgi:putative methylase